MLTLLGSLLGFLTSLAPDFLKIFQDFQDKKHELRVFEMQMRMAKANHDWRLEEIGAQVDMAESAALHKRERPIGHPMIDRLRGSVRPIITYAFFALFAYIKIVQITHFGIDAVLDTPWLVWTQEDQAIFAAIISYWFGSRGLDKARKHQLRAAGIDA